VVVPVMGLMMRGASTDERDDTPATTGQGSRGSGGTCDGVDDEGASTDGEGRHPCYDSLELALQETGKGKHGPRGACLHGSLSREEERA